MAQRSAPTMARKTLIAAMLGTLTEWYDFAVYGYMATVIATVFFPEGTSSTVALLATLAIYGVAFIARPIGSLLFGSLGDRIGRRTTLAIVVTGMGIATLLTGLLPTYATAGIAAPLLLVFLRMCQGLFAGGELTGASSLVFEWAPARRRGFWVSLVPTTTAVAFLLAVGVVLLVESVTGPEAWASWGWRIPFLFGGVISMVGLYTRAKLDDSPEFEDLEQSEAVEQNPLRGALRSCRRQIIAVGGGVAIYAVAYYVFAGLMPTYLKETVKAEPSVALLSNLFAFVVLALAVPTCGALCDAYGRRPVLVAGVVGTLALFVPGFLLAGTGTLLGTTAGQVLLVLPIAALNASLITTVVEIFPTHVRVSASSVSWNLAQTIFGGTAPLVGALLVSTTGLPLAPALYVLAIAVVGSVVMLVLRLPETRDSALAAAAEQTDTASTEPASSARPV
ncbi:MFS transporter [Streptomyces sp. NPDC059142]|uniref:MFS transporter n=1 Tax=Streptomyces sp. NPDC059142 TaxID=3346739 RepID=UPI0036957113